MYKPAEDSIFFKEFLTSRLRKLNPDKDFSLLDVGAGTGFLADTCSKFISKKNIFCVDIQEDAVFILKENGFRAVKSNLFAKIPKKEKFDIILFNAPYLPRNKDEDKNSQIETTGGTRGDEISLRFLKQAKDYLKKNGRIFLLISSLTPMSKIKKFTPKIVARKKIWFEELLILEF